MTRTSHTLGTKYGRTELRFIAFAGLAYAIALLAGTLACFLFLL